MIGHKRDSKQKIIFGTTDPPNQVSANGILSDQPSRNSSVVSFSHSGMPSSRSIVSSFIFPMPRIDLRKEFAIIDLPLSLSDENACDEHGIQADPRLGFHLQPSCSEHVDQVHLW